MLCFDRARSDSACGCDRMCKRIGGRVMSGFETSHRERNVWLPHKSQW